jgi:hypothetical protein
MGGMFWEFLKLGKVSRLIFGNTLDEGNKSKSELTSYEKECFRVEILLQQQKYMKLVH